MRPSPADACVAGLDAGDDPSILEPVEPATDAT
jgi:hypothetical protein